jgi:GT2 family glycosyltransferase
VIRIRVSIVSHNNAETIRRCIESVQSQRGDFQTRISIVDNDSKDGTVEVVRENYRDVELMLPGGNIGFGAGHNRVLRSCDEPYALLINPDAWLLDGALERLVAVLETNEDTALVGPRMEYEDGSPQLSFGRFPGWFADLRQRQLTGEAKARRSTAAAHLNRLLESPFHPDWISASCFLARMKAVDAVGHFDERYFLYLEDVDLCRRLLQQGWRVRVEPDATCRHLEGHSSSSPDSARRQFRRSRLLYENKFGSRLGFFLYKLLRARETNLDWDAELRENGSP